ncbi:MAG: DUF2975 domain-containing protein [Candidatus Ventricola sp.]
MKKLEETLSPRAVFTALRVAAIAAGVIGTLLAAWLLMIGGSCLSWGLNEHASDMVGASVTGILAVLAVGVCCWRALLVFIRMVGRLERGSAFTEENARALGRIAAMLALSGAVLLAALVLLAIICGTMVLPMVYLMLLALAFFGLALIAYALNVLVRRAAALQQDSDLTI